VIYRGFVGKEFPPFTVELDEHGARDLVSLLLPQSFPETPSWPPLCNWPAPLTLRGSACLMAVWEELGVDPLHLRLIREDFRHHEEPVSAGVLTGRIRIEDISEHVDAIHGIEDQVDLAVSFRDKGGSPVAEYRCSFRVPIAGTRTP
jgi:hypothetical protein